MPKVATIRSTLLVRRNGMRLGLVSGTRFTFTPRYVPISFATSMSYPSGSCLSFRMPYGGRSTSTPILIVPRLRISSIVWACAGRRPASPASSVSAASIRVSHFMVGFLSTFRSCGQPLFKAAAGQGQRPAQGEVDRRNDAEDQERAEGGVVQHLPRPRQLHEADDRGERGAL